MRFYETTRKLISTTGYLKNVINGAFYTSPMFLGIYDLKDNYIEATESEYDEYLKEELKKMEEENYGNKN